VEGQGWLALGVTTELRGPFRYDTKGVFTGYSMHGNIFSYEQAHDVTQGVSKRWVNGKKQFYLFILFYFMFICYLFFIYFV